MLSTLLLVLKAPTTVFTSSQACPSFKQPIRPRLYQIKMDTVVVAGAGCWGPQRAK